MACATSKWSQAEPQVSDYVWGELLLSGTNGGSAEILPKPGTSGGWLAQLFPGTNLFGAGTNLVVPFSAGTNGALNFQAQKVLSPGVYLSKPYVCIVIMPDASCDPQMVIDRGNRGDSKMLIEPEVKLVPWPEVGARAASK